MKAIPAAGPPAVRACLESVRLGRCTVRADHCSVFRTNRQSREICDDLDNDCDGMTDEGNPGGGGVCDGSDSDLCMEGTYLCQAGSLSCSDNTGSLVDVCNGLDDDCDPSSPDGSEDPLLGSSCDGPDGDLCAEGTYLCQAGSLSCSDNTGSLVDVCKRSG